MLFSGRNPTAQNVSCAWTATDRTQNIVDRAIRGERLRERSSRTRKLALRLTKPLKPAFDLTSVKLHATVDSVTIRSFAHKGLKKLYAQDNPRGVPPGAVEKLRKMLAFLDDMQDPEELRSLASWNAHTLTGDRKGTWSLNVTRNHRLTFRVDAAEREVCDVNLEDYH